MARLVCSGKQSWPELVGKHGEAAAAVIEKENPNVHAIVLKDAAAVTPDLSCNRVRVFVNKDRVVVRTPYVG